MVDSEQKGHQELWIRQEFQTGIHRPETPEDQLKAAFRNGDVSDFGKNPADVVEKWINGEFDWQTTQKVPDWMVPNIDE